MDCVLCLLSSAPKRAGHSLGGALAVLASLEIRKQFPDSPMTVYTWGAPRASLIGCPRGCRSARAWHARAFLRCSSLLPARHIAVFCYPCISPWGGCRQDCLHCTPPAAAARQCPLAALHSACCCSLRPPRWATLLSLRSSRRLRPTPGPSWCAAAAAACCLIAALSRGWAGSHVGHGPCLHGHPLVPPP